MPDGTLTEFLHRLRWSLGSRGASETTDTELLRRFLDDREEAAFAALVQRHGPMVLSVCQYVVQNAADADDAFQATFLVLVRRAASIRKPHLLANWLYGVAYRVAARARVQTARRRAREIPEVEMIAARPGREGNDWSPVLHDELNHLPEKYRAPIVLCYLQGKTNLEAARLLAWPVGTVKGRLTRARALLRKRLTRRGVALSAGCLATALTPSAASAAVPVALVDSTVRAAMLFAAGHLATAGVSAPVAALTKGALQSMLLSKLTTVCSVVMAVSLLGVTTVLVTHRTLAAAPQPEQLLTRSEPSPASPVRLQQEEQKPDAAQRSEEEARRQSMNNLKILALAMHNYHDEYGQFPPAAIYSKDGRPLLSWRVLLLPYLEQRDLFNQFKLDEPWDGPTNKKLLAKMPDIYSFAPGKDKKLEKTVYQVFTGAGTIFPSPNASKISDITDGTSNTIMIVEAADAVEWTKPADLPYDPKKPLPKFGGISKKGFQAAFADGSVHFLKQDIKEATLRALITRNGGEVIDINDLN
jgi:RNA polymerase sigma factor (sigma-70 family)